MNKRLKLQELFENLLDSENVYFQPPEDKKIKYPAIIYKIARPNVLYGNDNEYKTKEGYSVTVVDANPDSAILKKVDKLPFCSFSRAYTAFNLNHTVYTLYF